MVQSGTERPEPELSRSEHAEPETAEPEQYREQCSVPEAARRLGITERAVRKRIGAGTLPAERIDGRWYVVLGVSGSEVPARDRGERARPAKEQSGSTRTAHVAPSGHGGSDGEPEHVPVQHAAELLHMLRDLQRQNLELAGQVGFLQARLASTQEQLLLAQEEPEPEQEHGIEAGAEPERNIGRRSFLDRLFGR